MGLKPKKKEPRPRQVYRVLVTRTQYRVVDVEAEHRQQAADFVVDDAYEQEKGWIQCEMSSSVDAELHHYPPAFYGLEQVDREKQVEKVSAPPGYISPYRDDSFDDED